MLKSILLQALFNSPFLYMEIDILLKSHTTCISGKTLTGLTYLPYKEMPDNYECIAKINNRLKDTWCGPIHALQHMLSNLLEFDIVYIAELNIAKWNIDLAKKVNNLKIYILLR